ncbi:MAG TPA: FKBP-type peptidyl-prolyl cis-trans isomerase [Caulobacteraceae bacterium]|jgi:peptidylprolyl isomerase/FKBP-type peptidyl-prolyl cis-trans isomerase FklB|nr:FKBP-type peptidyl-prolyl cis-trans isomerase [Caulobacteraceae bacterium]
MRIDFAPAAAALAALMLATPALAQLRPPPIDTADAFLARHAAKPGVKTIPGVQYRVIRSGREDGRQPTRADDVTVRYQGRLTSGVEFDATPPGQTTTFELKRLIPGWITALQLMRPGDVWELWVPPQMAYGFTDRDKIPAGSVLDFTVELVGVAPHRDPPAP